MDEKQRAALVLLCEQTFRRALRERDVDMASLALRGLITLEYPDGSLSKLSASQAKTDDDRAFGRRLLRELLRQEGVLEKFTREAAKVLERVATSMRDHGARRFGDLPPAVRTELMDEFQWALMVIGAEPKHVSPDSRELLDVVKELELEFARRVAEVLRKSYGFNALPVWREADPRTRAAIDVESAEAGKWICGIEDNVWTVFLSNDEQKEHGIRTTVSWNETDPTRVADAIATAINGGR